MAPETTRNKSIRSTILGQLRVNGQKRSNLRMAPMIDMIFLLLIFFLVAGKWRPEEDILPFQLPAAQTDSQRVGVPEALVIHIFPTESGCQVQIGQFYTVEIEDSTTEANLAVLMEKMKDVMAAQKRFVSDPIEIACDAKVKWEHLTKIYNMFFGAGLRDITFRMTE